HSNTGDCGRDASQFVKFHKHFLFFTTFEAFCSGVFSTFGLRLAQPSEKLAYSWPSVGDGVLTSSWPRLHASGRIHKCTKPTAEAVCTCLHSYRPHKLPHLTQLAVKNG